MTNRSASSIRGWNYALLIACTLIALFCAGNYVSQLKKPAYYHAPRTTTLSVTTRPGTTSRIVSEPIPMEIEPTTEYLDRSEWNDYKSEAPTSIAMIEPPSGVRLVAPLATGFTDPFVDHAAQPRLAMGTAEAEDSISASAVSAAIPVTHRIDGRAEKLVATTRTSFWSRHWPRAPQLERQIAALREGHLEAGSEVSAWLARVDSTLTDLQQIALDDSRSESLLQDLGEWKEQGLALSRSFADQPPLAHDVALLTHSLERRYDVWTSVHQCVRNDRQYVAPRQYEIDWAQLASRIAAVRKSIAATEDTEGWSQYLMLDRLQELAEGRIDSEVDQVALARKVLGRITSSRVSPVQRRILKSEPVHRLADQVHPLTLKPVDYRKLLTDIETLESNPVHRCSNDLADAIQSLRFSEHQEQGAISAAINTHYRNANVRLSVSKDFLNRMMPRDQVTSRPVQQRILGADTRGASRVETNLKVDLIPDPEAWRLVLNLDGDIQSNTQSSRNGVTFYNSSNAQVQSNREIRVDSKSLQINGTPARVASSDSLRRFSTNWDSMPFVGDMVRYIAHQEFTQSRPVAKRITQRLIAKQTDEELDRQLREKVDTAQQNVDQRLLGPLQSLDLNPLVLDMRTTSSHLIARYRVAGSEQLSACTARPMAPADSLLAVQLHHSVFNNLIDQAIDTRRDWTIQSLSDQIADILQQPRPELPSDTPTDVCIRFMEHHPMTIEFEDGRMWFTLRIEALEQPGRIQLKNFTIRTSYAATVDRLQGELVRDGVISIDGHRMGVRDRLPLRAIFTKVFTGRSSLPMVSRSLLEDPRAQGLAVSQLEMRDGWLAIAVSLEESPGVASLKANSVLTR